MRRTIGITVVVALIVGIGTVAAWTAGGVRAQTTETVELGNLWFCDPSYQEAICETTITVGDTIVWENTAGLHTVTECNSDFTVCPPDGGFDSGFFDADESYSYTFTTAGSFNYWCALHPIEMLGRVIVQEAKPTPSPTPAPTTTPVGETQGPPPDVTATPVSVPGTGGPTGTDHSSLPLGGLFAGVLATLLGAAAVFRFSATVR